MRWNAAPGRADEKCAMEVKEALDGANRAA